MKIKRYFYFLSRPHLNYYRVMHGVKTAIACLVGLAMEKYFDWPMGQWIPITIMVVMSAQPHFGAVVRKAYMRFLGTISGVAIVVTVLWFFGPENQVVIFSTVFLASILFAYIACSHGDINYAGTLGGVTVILVLSGQQISIETAAQRGCYIIIGIIVALLVSRFIFPMHSRDRLRYHVASALRNLGKLYSEEIKAAEISGQDADIAELSAKVASDIASQPRLIHESVVGELSFAPKKVIFDEIQNSEQSLHRLINLMGINIREAEPIIIKNQLAELEDLHFKISESLKYLSNCFEASEQPQVMVDLDESWAKIVTITEKLPKVESPQQLIAEHSFLFFIEHILKELENMRKLIIRLNGLKENR